jgi:hypothetical protein
MAKYVHPYFLCGSEYKNYIGISLAPILDCSEDEAVLSKQQHIISPIIYAAETKGNLTFS